MSEGISATTLLAECLDRIAVDDGRLGAIIALDPSATAQAAALDRIPPSERGPLHGVVLAVKDNIDVAGVPTTSGCRALVAALPHRDAEQVRRLRAAEAVIVAKTNLSEFSFEIRSRSSVAGDVRNPFDRDVTAGGSSGGTAAAIAAGFAAAGLGTDTGGSVRVPASYTGLVGLRPTHGLLDLGGVAPLAPSADTIGPIARSAADVARLFAVMAGTSVAGRRPLAGRRIGVLRQAFTAGEVGDVCTAALDRLAAAGAVPVAAVLPEADLPTCPVDIVDHEFAAAFDAYLATNFACGAPSSLRAIYDSGAYLADYRATLARRLQVPDLAGYTRLREHRRRLRRSLAAMFAAQRLDAVAYPTSAVVPSSLDNPRGGWGLELAAYTGVPAITVPIGRSAGGMPIGLDLLGRRLGDTALIGLAQAVEDALRA